MYLTIWIRIFLIAIFNLRLVEKHKIEDGYIEEERDQVPFYINSDHDDDDSSDESACSEDSDDENDLEPLTVNPLELIDPLGHQEYQDWQAGQSPPPQPPPKRPRWCFRDLKHSMNFQNDDWIVFGYFIAKFSNNISITNILSILIIILSQTDFWFEF